MQTILGAGGDIGTPLAKELKKFTDKIRLVARNPEKVNEDDELFPTNLLDVEMVKQATKDSEVVYLTVGLPYQYKIWKMQWPIIIENTINACLESNSKLVFLDNVYMYDQNEIPHMTELSAINPPSKKGQIRARILEMLMKAQNEKGLELIIARSADFYGPNSKNGVLNTLVITNFLKGKTAQWQANLHKNHSFTYTLDAAKGVAILGNTPSAYYQTWHIPTSNELFSGKDFVDLVARKLNKKPKVMVLSPFLMKLVGLFSPVVKELVEMQYQNNQDYFFDSSKFNSAFEFTPKTYEQGISEILEIEGSKR